MKKNYNLAAREMVKTNLAGDDFFCGSGVSAVRRLHSQQKFCEIFPEVIFPQNNNNI